MDVGSRQMVKPNGQQVQDNTDHGIPKGKGNRTNHVRITGSGGTNPAPVTSDEQFRTTPALVSAQTESRKNRNSIRASAWKAGKSAKPDFSAKVETAEVSAPLYSVGPILGLVPVTQRYGHNLDFSTFPLLVERTFRDMQTVDDRLSRKMPYSMFLHHCTVALNANIIDLLTNENKEGGLREEGEVAPYLGEMSIPQPVAEYISAIGSTTTQSGDKVCTNIPLIARPKIASATVGEAGTFGAITAQNHNLYECYVAPRVTRRRIAASLDNNQAWTPLAPALMLNNSIATVNFLGYGTPDQLTAEGRNALSGLQFPEDEPNTGIEARLQYSGELSARVNAVLKQIESKYKIVSAQVVRRETPGFVGFLETLQARGAIRSLVDANAQLWSSNAAGASLSNMQYLFGLKRKRNRGASGPCVTVDAATPAGFVETMNRNFDCHPPFALLSFADDPSLRSARYAGVASTGSRSIDLDTFISSHFHKEKRT